MTFEEGKFLWPVNEYHPDELKKKAEKIKEEAKYWETKLPAFSASTTNYLVPRNVIVNQNQTV